MTRLLLIEDDGFFADMLRGWLESERYCVDIANDGTDGLQRLSVYDYDVLLIDWELPGLSGVEIVDSYRKRGGRAPVLMITGRRTLDDKERGFDSGTDDYLTKPFELRELSMRLRALLRRSPQFQANSITCGDLTLDFESCILTKRGVTLNLRPKELELLQFFMRNPKRVFSIEALIERVWRAGEEATPEAVRASIKRLRKVIDDNATNESFIANVHGLGYRFEPLIRSAELTHDSTDS